MPFAPNLVMAGTRGRYHRAETRSIHPDDTGTR